MLSCREGFAIEVDETAVALPEADKSSQSSGKTVMEYFWVSVAPVMLVLVLTERSTGNLFYLLSLPK